MPAVATHLRANLALNGASHVRVHEVCVGEHAGSVSFEAPTRRNSGIGHIVNGNSSAAVARPCICLDEFLAGDWDIPTLLKIDIEGAEWLAILGARKALERRQALTSILMEIHPDQIAALGGTVPCLADHLRAMGFTLWGISAEGKYPLQSPKDARFWWITSE